MNILIGRKLVQWHWQNWQIWQNLQIWQNWQNWQNSGRHTKQHLWIARTQPEAGIQFPRNLPLILTLTPAIAKILPAESLTTIVKRPKATRGHAIKPKISHRGFRHSSSNVTFRSRPRCRFVVSHYCGLRIWTCLLGVLAKKKKWEEGIYQSSKLCPLRVPPFRGCFSAKVTTGVSPTTYQQRPRKSRLAEVDFPSE